MWNEQDLAGENQKIVEVLRHEDRGWLLGVGPLKYSLEDEVILRTECLLNIKVFTLLYINTSSCSQSLG